MGKKKRNALEEQISMKDMIAAKKATLENARVKLKEKFFGIDSVIDKFISSVESWYIFPELRLAPLVINLWGITGVGKTALIREFVQLINKENAYFELNASSNDTYKLEDVFEESNITEETQGIIFLDEFQNLRTINEKGEEEAPAQFIDLWTFLSDGSFPVPHDIEKRINNLIDDLTDELQNSEDGKVKGYYVTRLYRILSLSSYTVKVDDIKKMSIKDAIDFLIEAKGRFDTYLNKSFPKMLIINAGNLDEVFTFSRNVDDADIDADIMNELSDEIKMTSVKRALLARFRPEQISRLGNIHIIYPVLDKESYKKIIEDKCKTIVSNFENKTKVSINILDSMKDGIYSNGVFPNQGVRPLFSTISIFLENTLSDFMIEAISSNATSIEIGYDKDAKEAICICNGQEKRIKIDNTLDDIRETSSEQEKMSTAIHEAGHALIEAVAFGVAPKQVTIKSSSVGTGGFCTSLKTIGSKRQLIDIITFKLGGRAAEQIVFGDEKISNGASSDIENATYDAMDFMTAFGFGSHTGLHDGKDGLSFYRELQDECDLLIEDCLKKSIDMIKKNNCFFEDLVEALLEKETLNDKDIIEIGKKNKITLRSLEKREIAEEDYISMWDKFKKKPSFLRFF